MTLSQAAIFTKRFLVGFVVIISLIIISFVGYRMWRAYYLASLPPKVELPETRFGALPPIDLPRSIAPPTSFTYSIDTTTGNLPDFEKMTKVYFMPKGVVSLLSSEKAADLANKLGIRTQPTILSETQYSFEEGGKRLIIEIDTGNFIYENPLAETVELGPNSSLNQGFKNVLAALDSLKPELGEGPQKIQKDGARASISVWPKQVDSKPILTSDFNKSLVNGTTSGSGFELKNYSIINYTFWPVDLSESSTYPIKTATMALDDLKAGLGVIVIAPSESKISILNTYLGYFESENYSPYLQPIYIFEGPNFVAYVPAVTQEFASFNPK
jgi:hypothetical protein